MKRFFTFILLLGSLLSFAQSPTLSDFVGKFTFQGFSAGGTSDVTGTLDGFSDQTNQYFASAIQTGDVVWDNLGNRWEVMAVNSSNLLQADVDLRDVNSAGGVPSGVGFVSRETDQIGLSLFVPDNNIGISQQLKSRVESHNMLLLEQYITANQDSVYQGENADAADEILNPTMGDILVTDDGYILFYNGNQWITYAGGGGSPDGNGIYSSSDTIPNGIKATVRDSFEFNGILGGYDEPGATFAAGKVTRYDTDYWGEGLQPWGTFQSYDYGGGTQIAFSGTYPYAAWMQDVTRSPTEATHLYQDWNRFLVELASGSNKQSLTLSSSVAELRGGPQASPAILRAEAGTGNISLDAQQATIYLNQGTGNIDQTAQGNINQVANGSINVIASSGSISQLAQGSITMSGSGLVGITKSGTTGFLSINSPDDQIIIQGEETQLKGDTAIIIQAGAGEDIVIKNNDITFPNTVDGTLDKVLGLNAAGKLITSDPGGGSDTNIYNQDGTIPAGTDRQALLDPTASLHIGDTASVGLSLFPADNVAIFGESITDPSTPFYTGLTVDPVNKTNLISTGPTDVFVQIEGGASEQIILGCDDTRIASHTNGYAGLTFDNGGNDYAILTNAITMRFMGQSAVNPIMDISHAAPTSFVINPTGEVQFNFYDQNKHDEVTAYGHQVLDQNGLAKKVYDGEFNFRDDANTTAQNFHTVITVNTTMTLPAATSNTGKVYILIANNSTNPSTPRSISVTGGGNIDGDNDPILLEYPGEVRALVSTGSEYVTLWKNTDTRRHSAAPNTFAEANSGTLSAVPEDGYTAFVNAINNGDTVNFDIDPSALNAGDIVYVIAAAEDIGATVNINVVGGANILYRGEYVTTITVADDDYLELKLVWIGNEFWVFRG